MMQVDTILIVVFVAWWQRDSELGDKTPFLDKVWRLNAANGDATLHHYSYVGYYTAQGGLCRSGNLRKLDYIGLSGKL